MQSRDGGWAAFDVDNDWAILNNVPFADHNAMLDPTCPDITGRVLEALSRRHGSGGARKPSAWACSICCEPRSATEAGTAAGA
jgi:squalene cyclase